VIGGAAGGVHILFFWACLTERAFQITVKGQPISSLEAAFDAFFIDWTRHARQSSIADRAFVSHVQ